MPEIINLRVANRTNIVSIDYLQALQLRLNYCHY